MKFKVTAEQQSVIDLITTWEPKNIKLALILDKTQNLNLEHIYREFLKEINAYPPEFEDKYQYFPIEMSLFERLYKTEWVSIPDRFKSESEIIEHIKKRCLLFGRNKFFVLEDWSLSETVDWNIVIKEVNTHYKDDQFLRIEQVPF